MKVKKLLLSIALMALAVLLMFNTKTYAATGSWKLGVVKVRQGITTKNGAESNTTKYSYELNTKPVLKIVDKTSGTADYRNAIYCLKAGQGFGSDNYTMSDVVYNTYYDMVTEKSQVNSILNLSNANYGSILWLLDNIYLPKQTPIETRQQSRNKLLKNAFASEFSNVNSFFYDWKVNELYITDDDIEVIQQWALWYFTNENESNSNIFHTDVLPALQISRTGIGSHTSLSDEGPELTDWADSTKEGYVREQEAEVLYNYLINTAKANSNYSKVPTTISINHNTNPVVKQSTILNTTYMIAGPFEIIKTGNTEYTFSGNVVDKNGNNLQYTICDANGNAISGKRTLEDTVGNGQFYIKIEKSNLTSNNITDIKLQITYTTNDTKATFWTVSGSNVDQPVVVVERTPKTEPDEIEIHIPKFDLALRKYIVGVTRNGVKQDISELTGRIPDINKVPLNSTDTTAEYKHRKDPVPVETGDLVEYIIAIYNEGEIAGRATEIIDYLPEGLEFYSANSTDYTFTVSSDKRKITITQKTSDNLAAYDGTTLDSKEIKFTCVVTKKEDKLQDTILTNIAEITECYDANNVKMYQTGDDRDSEPNNLRRPTDENLPSYKGNDSNKSDLTDKSYHYKGQQDDDDFEKLKVTTPEFDLALRKFITHINGTEVENSREPVVDTTPLKNGTGTTAKYTHPKNPLVVKIGETVRYKIRIYNEGDVDGYVTVIEDYLPEELEMVPTSESTINEKYGWSVHGRVITSTYLNGQVIKAYDGGDKLDYKDVEIECRVKDTENVGKILTNIAQINGESQDDRDSKPSNVVKPTDTNLPEYAENQEDDDDYEKVKIYQPEYDLALRKFIVEINGVKPDESRVPVVDVTPLKDGTGTTAKYTHPKNPLVVRNGDIVVYTIRVYNEGKFNGYAEEIKDNIPEGLEYIIDNEINIEYRWKLSDDEKQVSTDYLSKGRDKDNVIKAFDSDTMETLDYKDVKIAFKVIEPNTSTRIITNIAEIKKDDGKDIDSTPDNDIPDEDDIDVEHIKLKYFDLALRKFITKVESKTGENLPIETDETKDVSREPKVEIDENGKIKYIHPKDPVIVANSDVVIYTLRVYNEGGVDGYADEIKDDVPNGLELIPDHEINVQYGWVMYDEDGKVTDDPEKAKTIRTTYLSEEKSEDNVIKAFDRETMDTPDYKEVKVAFKVVEKNVDEERIIINTAEISKDSDDDEDSTPDNDVPNEDDIDKEYVEVKYFDLSLLKWVSKVMITEKGETKVTETGFNGLEDPEPVVKIELKPNQINSIVLKYEYGIKITNEGQIAGYAKEVADYIPEGLEFIPEDNPLWKLEKDGKIVTRQLEDKLLQPGESTIITVVFKWKNSKDNFGTKVNWAEISEDANDKDAEDIDSTPDNEVRGEDDIDYAVITLIPKTGQVTAFIILPTIVLAVLSTGIVLIKKYVL